MTDTAVETFEEFRHGSDKVVFSHLRANGPTRLIEGPTWAFVDWVMQDISGLEMCRRLRADPRMEAAHVTMVLDEDNADAKRRALNAGADDYVVGSLDRRAVLDRVLSLGRVSEGPKLQSRITSGDLEIDLDAQLARWAGKPMMLGPNEFSLLRYFAENSDRVLTREEVIRGLGKQDPPVNERTVDVWIGRLRRALQAAGAGEPIRTIRFRGYVFDTR